MIGGSGDDLGDRLLLRGENLDAGIPQRGECTTADAGAGDCVHLMMVQKRRVMAAEMILVAPGIPHDLQVAVIRIDQGEVGGTTEVSVELRFEPAVVLGGDAEFHGSTPS